MNTIKIAHQLYKYTYPNIQLQQILDLISENYHAWDKLAWEKTMKYYRKLFGHSWIKYVYRQLDYPDLFKLDIITSFKEYYASLREEVMTKRIINI